MNFTITDMYRHTVSILEIRHVASAYKLSFLFSHYNDNVDAERLYSNSMDRLRTYLLSKYATTASFKHDTGIALPHPFPPVIRFSPNVEKHQGLWELVSVWKMTSRAEVSLPGTHFGTSGERLWDGTGLVDSAGIHPLGSDIAPLSRYTTEPYIVAEVPQYNSYNVCYARCTQLASHKLCIGSVMNMLNRDLGTVDL